MFEDRQQAGALLAEQVKQYLREKKEHEPGSAVVVALLFVESFNLPVEIAAIVAGVYRLIDMGCTTVNVMGDLVGTVIVSDLETSNRTA